MLLFFAQRGQYLVTSTLVIEKPVNCVLAGHEYTLRQGRAAGRMLRAIFRE